MGKPSPRTLFAVADCHWLVLDRFGRHFQACAVHCAKLHAVVKSRGIVLAESRTQARWVGRVYAIHCAMCPLT